MKTLIVVLAACIAYVSAQAGCPRIVTRSEWGARPPYDTTALAHPVQYVVIHHTAGPSCSSQTACTSTVQSIQDQHMDINGWDDIGYNFLVGGDNNIYEGRGWLNWGAHSPNYNSRSIGICFIGTFTSSLPLQSSMDNAQQLIQCGMDARYIQYAHSLIGHRQDVNTECPGDALYAEIQTWPNYDPTP